MNNTKETTPEKKKKGKNYMKATACMVCGKPRTIRGKLCVKCREDIKDSASEAV